MSSSHPVHIHDGPLIIGAGLAGLNTALHAAPMNVLVLAPSTLGQACSSAWAQGGIAAALGSNDSPAQHARDTEIAGAGLVNSRAAATLTQMAPGVVRQLNDLGAPFDHKADGSFALSREAAHSMARVARVGGDLAGKAILEAVVAAALKASHITIWENAHALALLKNQAGAVCGALIERDGETIRLMATHTVLATGGLGGLYAVTTNPASLRGEGMAMAALAGADRAEAEFVQFHPTAIKTGGNPAPLATEALRGDGAILVTRDGTRFCFDVHMDGELAPRDIVARAVFHADRDLGGAFLDARQAIGSHFPEAFPTVFASCMQAGIDPRTDLIPVVPAEHYHMGGIATDLDGRASLTGLYAVGECASTGVHGANRLASNSLLEAAAFGERVALALKSHSPVKPEQSSVSIAHYGRLSQGDLVRLRLAMSQYAGVIREAKGLQSLLDLIVEMDIKAPNALPLIAAHLVAQGAMDRRESRGAHFRSDYPKLNDPPRHSVSHGVSLRRIEAVS